MFSLSKFIVMQKMQKRMFSDTKENKYSFLGNVIKKKKKFFKSATVVSVCMMEKKQPNKTKRDKTRQDETHFLNRCLSSVTPSDVFFKVSLRVSMHSFSRGSPLRSPVALRA